MSNAIIWEPNTDESKWVQDGVVDGETRYMMSGAS